MQPHRTCSGFDQLKERRHKKIWSISIKLEKASHSDVMWESKITTYYSNNDIKRLRTKLIPR